jgi:XRE family aerobic/anaerobic benzoate catabolism transcriptional regulator
MSRRSSSQQSIKAKSASRKAKSARRATSPSSSVQTYLHQLGENLRAARTRRAMTLAQVARKSALSARFLGNVEVGRANISVARLYQVARALGLPVENLITDGQPASPPFEQSAQFLKKLAPAQLRDAHKLLLEKFSGADSASRRFRVALIGLRGAGKSTLGSLLAQILRVPFIELDKQIERDSGVNLTIIFDLYGQSGYRRMERQALESILAKYPRFVLATGGSIVSDPAGYNRLLSECFTVWLRTKPEEHMARVLAQGDRRPMAHNRQAMRDLRRILSSREALYRQADALLETTNQTVTQSLQGLALLLRPSP